MCPNTFTQSTPCPGECLVNQENDPNQELYPESKQEVFSALRCPNPPKVAMIIPPPLAQASFGKLLKTLPTSQLSSSKLTFTSCQARKIFIQKGPGKRRKRSCSLLFPHCCMDTPSENLVLLFYCNNSCEASLDMYWLSECPQMIFLLHNQMARMPGFKGQLEQNVGGRLSCFHLHFRLSHLRRLSLPETQLDATHLVPSSLFMHPLC